MNYRNFLLITIIILFVIGTCCYWQIGHQHIFKTGQVISSNLVTEADEHHDKDAKTIVIWNRREWMYPESTNPENKIFKNLGCVHNNCIIVDKNSYPIDKHNEADCILFNTKDLKQRQIPVRERLDQIWVSWLLEAPLHWYPTPMREMNDMFNLTIGYLDHVDTDIIKPYGRIVSRSPAKPYKVPSRKMVQQKTKMIAWVVSNCHPASQRTNYVKKLSKYIPVDIFGRCGNNSCHGDCFNRIEKEYKYYLAFENAYCEDYITEKLYRTLNYDIIPIVLGGANYSHFLPPGSYINVQDFKSPNHLANYLRELAQDVDKYLDYFQWKRTESAESNKQELCDLCRILHDTTYSYKSHFNMDKYWNSSELCLRGSAEAKKLHLV